MCLIFLDYYYFFIICMCVESWIWIKRVFGWEVWLLFSKKLPHLLLKSMYFFKVHPLKVYTTLLKSVIYTLREWYLKKKATTPPIQTHPKWMNTSQREKKKSLTFLWMRVMSRWRILFLNCNHSGPRWVPFRYFLCLQSVELWMWNYDFNPFLRTADVYWLCLCSNVLLL
jgi:hypothetical protein